MDDKDEDYLLRRAVMRFASSRIESLARKLISEIKNFPSCGLYNNCEEAHSLWDDYCFDRQNGPATVLEFAWAEVFDPHLLSIINVLDQREATLLSIALCWSQGRDPFEILGNPPVGIDAEGLAIGIMDAVTQTALDRGWPDNDEGVSSDHAEGHMVANLDP